MATTITFSTTATSYTNIAGSGIDLILSCGTTAGGVGGSGCAIANAENGSPNFSDGLLTSGNSSATSNPIENNEYIIFTFNSSVTLNSATLTLTGSANNKFTVLRCTAAPCTTSSIIVSNQTATATPTFSTNNVGTIFRFEGSNPNSAFGIDALTFTAASVATPEPTTLSLIGGAFLLFGALRRGIAQR
ncbi:MAG: hypothetical protein ABJF23_19530 [Bryobacteraceae bacterium]